MKYLACIGFWVCSFSLTPLVAQPSAAEQQVDAYLKSIRQDVPALQQFFHLMPKGGDLHHHFSGSVYAETYLERAIALDFWLHRHTLTLQAPGFRPSGKEKKDWVRFSGLQAEGALDDYAGKLLQRWSKLYYEPARAESSPHDHFFNTFPAFDAVSDSCLHIGLQELKRRALEERVSYIETMFIQVAHPIRPEPGWNNVLRANAGDSSALFRSLGALLVEISAQAAFSRSVQAHNALVRSLHESLEIDDAHFAMRYQNYVLRVKPPAQVFVDMALSFASAQAEPLIVGVNIVAPEDHAVSMQDYALHMLFFRFLRQRYPGVKCALHAGELTLGLVRPEDLSRHIAHAVYVAGADRIGHGAAIAYEDPGLLRYMAEKRIPVEINLSSNAFILGIPPPEHPVSLYRRAGVPYVLSTDDAGVLRSKLGEEYVLLTRHHLVPYTEIKQLAFNSIRHSFIEEDGLRERLLLKLQEDFVAFEKAILQLQR